MKSVTKKQIVHKLGSAFSTFLLITMVIVLFSLLFFFPASEITPSFLTLLIALLSPLFLVSMTKKKGPLPVHENLVQDNMQNLELQPSLVDVTTHTERTQKSEQQENLQSDTSLPSYSESSASSMMSARFEIDHNRNQNVDTSHSLTFDSDEEEEEDSLIEIKLPSNHFWGSSLDHDQKLVSEFLPEIDEMNEDENLFEIDISM